MKKILLAFILISSFLSKAQMVLEYDIITPNTVIAIPLAGTVNVSVDWGDGTAIQTFTTPGNKSHTYTTIGTKTVTISGTLTAFGSSSNYNGNARLSKVLNWDGLGLQSLNYAFYYAGLLTEVPTSLPSSVTNLSNMFEGARSFNQAIGSWNTQNVTDMSFMFYRAKSFNQAIGTWNTQNVTDMNNMFDEAPTFNQAIGSWNTQNVTDMRHMFQYATSFNQPIGNWNTQNVTSMKRMFNEASSFNQAIGTWNTQNVTDMNSMFAEARSFNQAIGSWNTQNVTDMSFMFYKASSFNQAIGTWNTQNVTRMDGMFYGATPFNQNLGSWNIEKVSVYESVVGFMIGVKLCTDNYDSTLIKWAQQNVITNRSVTFGSSKYSKAGKVGRDILISKGWTITDGGLDTDNSNACEITVGLEKNQSQTEKTLLKTYNLQGQEITEETKGIQIRVYSDGSREKTFVY